MLSRRSRHRRAERPESAHAVANSNLDSSESEDDDEDESEGEGRGLDALPRFCFQHANQALEQKGTFVGSSGFWVNFDGATRSNRLLPHSPNEMAPDWIPSDLPIETKLQLRHEMTKLPSPKDRVGYIYCHEMARPASGDFPPPLRRTNVFSVLSDLIERPPIL
jgi:hypothetical protein